MKSKLVILDTEVFVRIRCDFAHSHMEKLKELPKSEVYSLAITDVTDREIESKILEQVNDYFNSALKLQKNVLSHRSFALFNINDSELEKGKAIQEAFKEYKSFKNKMEIEVISTNHVKTAEVLDLYFNERPPFSSKKKSEFPDAISLLAIDKKIGKRESIVISGDSDWKSFFENKSNFSFYSSISVFVDKLLTEESEILLSFKEQITSDIIRTKELIFSYILNYPMTVYLNGNPINIHQDNIVSFEVDIFNIVNVEKYLYGARLSHSYKRCDVDFDLTLNVKIRVDDPIICSNNNVSKTVEFQSFYLKTTSYVSFDVTEFQGSSLLTGLSIGGLSCDSWYINT